MDRRSSARADGKASVPGSASEPDPFLVRESGLHRFVLVEADEPFLELSVLRQVVVLGEGFRGLNALRERGAY